jgi:hypothetical protein
MIGTKNTFTARYSYETGTSTSPGGGNNLTTQKSSSSSADNTVQISDTQLLSNRVINETRFELEHGSNSSTPVNPATSVSVTGNFTTHGTGSGSNSSTSDHIEVQNYTSIQLAKNFIRLGGRLRTDEDTNIASLVQNGSLSYSYLLDPCTDPNASASNKANCISSATTPCQLSNMLSNPKTPGQLYPLYASYQCNVPFQFSQTTINHGTISARETDVGFYLEDDWKARDNLTISYGIRMEAQNFINSTHDFAPRLSIAYGIPRKNGKPTLTVLRGGFGIFYDRYSVGSITGQIAGNPTNQSTTSYENPGGNNVSPTLNLNCSPTNTTGCTTGSTGSSGFTPRIQVPSADTGSS